MGNLTNNNLKNLSPLESARIDCLRSYAILDSEIESEHDNLTRLAALICEAPISLISLIDIDRQWFKSHYGLDITETERCYSFCHHTIEGDDVLEVTNTLVDSRFLNNPLVSGDPGIRFYCGAPLINEDGYKLGSLCIIDKKPRTLSSFQKEALTILAKQVVTHFELRRQKNLLQEERNLLALKVEERTSELNEINKELNSFIYKASHDIRGPIATIMGLSNLALGKSLDNEIEHLFRSINKTSHKLDATLRNLLKVVQLKDYEVQIDELIGSEIMETTNQIISNYECKNVGISINIQPQIKFFTDKELFYTIINSVVDNAIRFLKDNDKFSSISIKLSCVSNGVFFSVEDNGEGIEDGSKERIFEMFYRGNPRSKGSGLGLFIVNKAVGKLKGSISFESSYNKGSIFKIFLPNLQEDKIGETPDLF